MNPIPESAAKLQKDSAARLRAIPSVDELLLQSRLIALAEKSGRALVIQIVRQVLADFRARLKNQPAQPARQNPEALDEAQLEARVVAEIIAEVVVRVVEKVESALAPSLRRVINATGVVLHTNLGRAPLSQAAVAQIAATAAGYSNLEYDTARGERGKRDVHTAKLLADLVGAESAIVVNNNAAAVFLVLNTLAKAAEVVVSRGELIEIGDGFRIPDIMAESGALLREVGTTNRTRLRDYERAITDHTRLLLRVHPSNFRITGFTERPSLPELVALGERFHLPVYEDLGSGCIADLSASGIAEPVARASCEAGASIITFSGDKLLGGPQAGIIAGKKEFVERIRANPLFRALRVDKLTIAALEATLQSYLRGAFDEIPTLRMIRLSPEEIAKRAQSFCEKFRPVLPTYVKLEIHPGFSVIGGGSTPDQQLPTTLIAISTPRHSAAQLEDRLRNPRTSNPASATSPTATPVIARIEDDRLILDLRSVNPEEESEIASALVAALA
jgi:L-seryl-tRNA(Ser) seleniumtransferase